MCRQQNTRDTTQSGQTKAVSPFRLRLIARELHQGAVIAYPTEAVYGLGCDPLNRAAVERLLAIKRRPLHKGLILIAASVDQLRPFARFDGDCLDRVEASWPGPHTWLLPAVTDLPYWINGGRDSVACRVTAHPVAAALCRAFGGPIVSTSANQAGQAPARNALQARLRCRAVDRVVQGATGGLHAPTPIRDAVSGEMLRGD